MKQIMQEIRKNCPGKGRSPSGKLPRLENKQFLKNSYSKNTLSDLGRLLSKFIIYSPLFPPVGVKLITDFILSKLYFFNLTERLQPCRVRKEEEFALIPCWKNNCHKIMNSERVSLFNITNFLTSTVTDAALIFSNVTKNPALLLQVYFSFKHFTWRMRNSQNPRSCYLCAARTFGRAPYEEQSK